MTWSNLAHALNGGIRSWFHIGRHTPALRFFVAIAVGIAIAGCDSRQGTSERGTSAPGATSADIQRREASALQGSWTLISFTAAEKTVEVTGGGITFAGDKMIMKAPAGETTTYLYRIDPQGARKTIELTDTQDTNAPPRFAIYELEGNSLRLCLGGEGKPPTAFGADGTRVFLLHRQ